MFSHGYDSSQRVDDTLQSGAPMIQRAWEFNALLEVYKALNPRRVLEIGTCEGGTLQFFLSHTEPGAQFITVEVNHTRPAWGDWADANSQHLTAICGDSHYSEIVAYIYKEMPDVDFLFIDADHHYGAVRQDFLNYGPLVRPGGIIALHDILDTPGDLTIEVSKLWSEIREAGYVTQELCSSYKQATCGIGLIYVQKEDDIFGFIKSHLGSP